MTIDEAIDRVRGPIRDFLADCAIENNGGSDDTFADDLEALDMVLSVASGNSDPRQMTIPGTRGTK